MALTKFTESTNVISSLANKPVETASDLKAKFDEIGRLIKDYINNTLTTEIDSKISEFQTEINSNTSSINDMLNKAYPVGSIYMSVDNTNPTTLFGGTWIAWGSGKVPVGVNTNESEFNSVEKTGGAKTHTLTVQQMPSHGHSVSIASSGSCTTGSSGSHSHDVGGVKTGTSGTSQQRICSQSSATSQFATSDAGSHTHTVPNHTHTVNQSNAGGGQAHNNLQPYITCYMWKRTA